MACERSDLKEVQGHTEEELREIVERSEVKWK
jgi:hypothetical protein